MTLMIQENVDLHPYNTFGLTAKAKRFAPFKSIEDLDKLINEDRSQEILVLDGGSKLIITQDVEALVLKNVIPGIEIIDEKEDYAQVKA